MSFASLNAGALKKSVSFMGQAFSYLGKTYKGVVNELTTKQQLDIGGFESSLTAAITVSKSQFPSPVIGGKITFNSIERRIVFFDQDQISYTLHLEDVKK